ncbi:zinc finger MYND domain-containing protein 12-like [Mytilus californianus]|uniref:zinc finger MYND domain-containing protein 12-like n=1 Tax=Mytilus californianus TaxID=6549 RepID=UPI00224628EF|nr:zinc finger MYND domain-containing protein 12-like [Mytilus californianus]
MTLNPLANPKGTNLNCELCQKPAFIQCTKCRVTYYCGVEHQKADWVGIHEKICQSLIALRQGAPFLPSQEERQKRERHILMKKTTMIDLTRTTGQKLLFEGRHEQAVPAAMQSLRFAIDVHGLDSIELVPSYLILGEASIGLGRLSQAEEYLAQAQWTVLKTPSCSNAIKSKLYRNLGLLYAAKGEYDDSLRQLADDIYHASENFGTDDIRTSGGYFHMANVFFRQGRMEIADSLYRQVSTIWYNHLQKIVKIRTKTPDTPQGIGPLIIESSDEKEDTLDEAQEAEAIQVLNAIYDMQEHQQSRQPQDLATICHALAMLYFILMDISKAKEFGRKAVVASEGHPDDSLSRTIVEFMKNLESQTQRVM